MEDKTSKELRGLTLKERLKECREIIFLIELAGLLHDTGKLDARFIDYRKKWQANEAGWHHDNDPHDDKDKPFFDFDPLLQGTTFQLLKECLLIPVSKISNLDQISLEGQNISFDIPLKEVMHLHTRVNFTDNNDNIACFIKLGDRVDSAYDRNNPLFSAEQKYTDNTYMATVFGHEQPIKAEQLDTCRTDLYRSLNDLLPGYCKVFDSIIRVNIFKETEKAFSKTVSDTCRPANDTTLWQHSYVTAALAKVFFNHFLIYGKKLYKEQPEMFAAKFSIFGFGWDGLKFISNGQKIADIAGRRMIIRKLKSELKKLVEWTIPIGMNIYDDDNGIFFVIPAIFDSNSEEYKNLLEEIKNEAAKASEQITEGEIELVASKNEVKPTHFIMNIVKGIEEIRKERGYPHRSKPSWTSNWANISVNTICPVCQKRPVTNGNDLICNVCQERRKEASLSYRRDKESLFPSEIADKNKRLALIVAKFGLSQWLRGDMIWTLFVKESKSLKRDLESLAFGRIIDQKIGEENKKRKKNIEDYLKVKGLTIPDIEYSYDVIANHIDKIDRLEELQSPEKEFIEAISPQYLRYSHLGWKEINQWIQEMKDFYRDILQNPVDTYNYFVTKNHTPSRLLNIWNTTREFLASLLTSEDIINLLPSFRRLQVTLDSPFTNLMENVIYEAVIFSSGEKIELLRQEDRIYVIASQKDINVLDKIKEWQGKDINILSSDYEKKTYQKERTAKIIAVTQSDSSVHPYRTITASPDLFMAIVPADKAVKISTEIYDKYIKHFGKVAGRLPFSIGNIFFKRETPMFVVLNAGNKMVNTFNAIFKYDERHKKLWDVSNIPGGNGIEFSNGVKWDIPYKFPDGGIDSFHPYLIVENSESNNHKNEGTFFSTCKGDLVHFSEIKRGYQLRVYPNYYDFEFLDSTSRRFDIHLDGETKRSSNLTCALTKPYYLDELKQKFEEFWTRIKELLPGISDTKLRNIEALWLSKLQEWKVDINDETSEETKSWRNLVETTLKKEFSRFSIFRTEKDEKDFNFLRSIIFSGLFFDCLEMNLRILKKRISVDGKEI